MKYIHFFLFILLCSCSTTSPKTTTNTPKEVCKKMYSKKGTYASVVVANCESRTIVGIIVLDTEKKGEKAAEEAIKALIAYFKGRPKMTLLTMSSVDGHPFYMFIVNKIEPPLQRLPGRLSPQQQRKKLHFF